MPKRIALRAVSEEEAATVRQLAKSKSSEMRLVHRAQVIVALLDEPQLSASEAGKRAGYKSGMPGTVWVARFNAGGVAGLQDEARRGRPVRHDETVRSALVALAVQKPATLGYPYALWTLERLQSAFAERQGSHLSDSTIWEWLAAEGLSWKQQQSWFRDVEQLDPHFAQKRGPLSRLT